MLVEEPSAIFSFVPPGDHDAQVPLAAFAVDGFHEVGLAFGVEQKFAVGIAAAHQKHCAMARWGDRLGRGMEASAPFQDAGFDEAIQNLSDSTWRNPVDLG